MATIDEILRQSQTPTRFARLMTPSNILEDMIALGETTRNAAGKVAKSTQRGTKTYQFPGAVPGDPQFDALMHFAEQPTAPDFAITDPAFWTEPLINPKLSPTVYYVRLRISQHMVNPLLQGFTIDWWHPDGWAWYDGFGTRMYCEAVSNPLDVVRQVRRITAPGPTIGFHAAIVTKYLP